jgi:plastocyanin
MKRLTKLYAAGAIVVTATLVSCENGQLSPTEQLPANAWNGSLSNAASAQASFPALAHMDFGIDEHGSPFPPPDQHDGSGHARDHVYPREVVIRVGGQVNFEIDLVHQVAIYEPGTLPGDIEVSPATLEDVDLGPFAIPNFRINDPNNRIVLGPPQQLFEQNWTTPAGTFDQPGRYLVICTTVPHFVASKMWGWVTVK